MLQFVPLIAAGGVAVGRVVLPLLTRAAPTIATAAPTVARAAPQVVKAAPQVARAAPQTKMASDALALQAQRASNLSLGATRTAQTGQQVQRAVSVAKAPGTAAKAPALAKPHGLGPARSPGIAAPRAGLAKRPGLAAPTRQPCAATQRIKAANAAAKRKEVVKKLAERASQKAKEKAAAAERAKAAVLKKRDVPKTNVGKRVEEGAGDALH